MSTDRESWKSRLGFLMAAVGSAVGLGNIWRFNYLAYKNGGGAFLIPYLIALVTAGLPILILEFGIGHKMRGAPPTAFEKVRNRDGRSFQGLGWWGVTLAMFGINLYYAVVISWCVSYFVHSFSMAWTHASSVGAFFKTNFLHQSSGIFDFGPPVWGIVAGLALVWFLNWVIVYKGVQSGIEKANKIFMPILLFLMTILVVRGITLPGAGEGLTQYLKPDFSRILDPQVWLDAYGQIFFTLSIGFGIMIAYSSYLPRKTNIAGNAKLTALLNSGFSLFTGLAVFGTIGYLAQKSGVPINQVVTEGPGLAFVVFPQAIAQIPFLKHLFGMVFFLALIVAGLSSSLSLVEAFASSVVDKFGWKRKKIVTILSVAGFGGGLLFTLPNGLYWLGTVDNFMTNYGLITVGLLQSLVIGWVYGADIMRRHLYHASGRNLGSWWTFCIKYFTPIVLLILLGVKISGDIGSVFVPSGAPRLVWRESGKQHVLPLSEMKGLEFRSGRRTVSMTAGNFRGFSYKLNDLRVTWDNKGKLVGSKPVGTPSILGEGNAVYVLDPDHPLRIVRKKSAPSLAVSSASLSSLRTEISTVRVLSSKKLVVLLTGLLWLTLTGFAAWLFMRRPWRNEESLKLGHHFEEGEDYHLH